MTRPHTMCRRALGITMIGLACAATARAQVPILGMPKAGAVSAAAPRQVARRNAEELRALGKAVSEAVARGDLAAAIAAAERRREAFPDEMEAAATLGALYLAAGQPGRAEPVLRTALGLQNALAVVATNVLLAGIHTDLAQIALDAGRPGEAIAPLERAIDLDPTTARPRFLLATALYSTGNDARGARENSAAFGVDPSAARPLNYMFRAQSQAAAGRLEEAAATLEAAIGRFPLAPGAHLALARVRRQQNRPAEALYELLYERMLERPGSPHGDAVRGEIASIRADAAAGTDRELGAVTAALDAFEAHREEEALRSLHDAMRVTKADPLVLQLMLAEGYVATGRFGEAERLLTEILEKRPKCLPALTTLASLFLSEGRRNGASALLERALRIDGANARLLELLEAHEE